MSSVEQRARDWIVESAGPLKLDRITPEEAWRIAYEAGFAAALREQPEARGVVDFEAWLDRDWPLWRNNPDNPIIARLRRAWDAALTAAQQPGQEGGGETYWANGAQWPNVAPPSAPVGVEGGAWTDADMQKPWGAEAASLRHLADDPALNTDQAAMLRHCAKRIESTAGIQLRALADMLDPAKQAGVLRDAADALPEVAQQPEARGVVDAEKLARLISEWELHDRTFGHDGRHPLIADFRAILTAAQQPGQEGGGETYWANGAQWPNVAPPSAPVGDRREIDRVIRELRAYNPASDEYRGEHIHGVWAKELERALTQQPAQAAPGDGRHEYVQSKEHSGCAVCGYAEHVGLVHRTTPGDDAAGGGHG